MNAFVFADGAVVAYPRRGSYTVELLSNGFARVDHSSGLVTVVEPSTGHRRSGVQVPTELVAEIQRRWGGS